MNKGDVRNRKCGNKKNGKGQGTPSAGSLVKARDVNAALGSCRAAWKGGGSVCSLGGSVSLTEETPSGRLTQLSISSPPTVEEEKEGRRNFLF